LFTIAIITIFTLLLLLLFYYYHHYKTVATDKPLRASLFPGADLGFISLEDCCDPLYLWVINPLMDSGAITIRKSGQTAKHNRIKSTTGER
jgi:hypothetical protein